MMPLWRPGTPIGSELPGRDEYAMWDAAYVLGSLSSAERRGFEAHQVDCLLCRSAIGELIGMPALLSQLELDEAVVIDGGAQPLPSDELLPSLLARMNLRRRRSRFVTWTAGSAAAAVLAIGVFLGAQGQSLTSVPLPGQASVSVEPMAQVGTDKLASTVSLSSEMWGTSISMSCVCLAPMDTDHDKVAMVVVGRDGSRTRTATWVAKPGRTATPVGSISTRVDQIASIQVISVTDGQVLLERSL